MFAIAVFVFSYKLIKWVKHNSATIFLCQCRLNVLKIYAITAFLPRKIIQCFTSCHQLFLQSLDDTPYTKWFVEWINGHGLKIIVCVCYRGLQASAYKWHENSLSHE